MLELNKIYNLDCLEFLKQIDSKSVDLVIIDPPYFQVMKVSWKGEKHEWDNQHKTLEEYQDWIYSLGIEIRRILKDNGSFYIFADDKICAYVQVVLDTLFYLENSITWVKPNNLTIKGWTEYKSYSPITEKILFYSVEFNQTGTHLVNNSISFKPSREYIHRKMTDKKMTYIQLDKILYRKGLQTKKSSHAKLFANPEQKQGHLIREEQYNALKDELGLDKPYKEIRKEFERLRKENEVTRTSHEETRRYFNPDSNFTDVWTFNIMGGKESLGKHPTQKPLEIIKRIIKTSSKEESIILDCFMGSGTTALACQQLNRRFIGCDNKEEYVELSNKRLSQQSLMFVKDKQKGTDGGNDANNCK